MTNRNEEVLSSFLEGKPVDLMELRTAVFNLRLENNAYSEMLAPTRTNRNRYSNRIDEVWNQDITLSDGTNLHHKGERKLPSDVVDAVLLMVRQAVKSRLEQQS